MPPDERKRLFEVRCKSKRGGQLTPQEVRFLDQCYRRYREQYRAMEQAVFDATKPFGAA